MLTFETVEQLLSRFTYKPNVCFKARRELLGARHEIRVEAVMWTLDSRREYPSLDKHPDLAGVNVATLIGKFGGVIRTPDGVFNYNPSPVRLAQYVPMYLTECGDVKQFWDWLHRYFIGELENHERDEWFRVDGELMFDPHAKDKR